MMIIPRLLRKGDVITTRRNNKGSITRKMTYGVILNGKHWVPWNEIKSVYDLRTGTVMSNEWNRMLTYPVGRKEDERDEIKKNR